MLKIDELTSSVCKDAFEKFVGTGLYIGLFLISILYILFALKKESSKEKKIKIVLGVYSIIVLAMNLNPIFTKFMIKILGESATYWRVYWLIPIGICIAYMFTEIVFSQEKKRNKILSLILIVAIIILAGDFIYNSDNFTKVSNYYKVPDSVLDIIFHVSEDDEEYKKLAGPEVFYAYTRQIDGNILICQTRSTVGDYGEDSIINYSELGDIKKICDYCVSRKSNYLVLNNDLKIDDEYMEKYSISNLYSNETYTLYKFENISE
jgi:hypothetical protein